MTFNYRTTRGTFRLKDVRQDIFNDEYVPLPAVWVDSAVTSHGYYVGGQLYYPSPYTAKTNVDKITYATETVSTPSSTFGSTTPYGTTAFMSYTNNGAFALMTSSNFSSIGTYKHNFTTDDIDLSPGLSGLYPASGSTKASGTATTGYFHKGTAPSGSYACQKVTFATETNSSLPASTGFSQAGVGSYSSVFQNQLHAGYTPAVSSTNPYGSICKKLTFSTDTFTNNGWTLLAYGYAYGSADAGSGNDTGYIVGGYTPSSWSPAGPTGERSSVMKISISSSGTASALPNISEGSYSGGGGGNSNATTAGYFSANSPASTTRAIKIRKINFSTDGISVIPATLSTMRVNGHAYGGASKGLPSVSPPPRERWFDGAGPSPSATPPTATPTASTSGIPVTPVAFIMAGRTSHPSGQAGSTCAKIQFASETRTALPGSNIPARMFVAGTSSTLAGYCFGDSNQIAKLLYSTDAASTLPSTLPGGYRYKSAISNDTVAFTFGGWSNYSVIDKLTFSNDTVSANTPSSKPPENIRFFTGQLSGPSRGYFCTGSTGPGYPGRDKKCWYIQYSNDSGSEGPEAPEIRDAVGSCSNATVGYITGGRGPGSPQQKSNTSKFTFATESWSNVPGAPLSAGTYALSGTSNQTFAYFSGGSVGGAGPAVKTTSRKFTFASETMGPGTSLGIQRWGFGFTANTESNHPQSNPSPNVI